jgi:N-dimethylarginine dimethylaminohydrolase
MDSTTEDVLDTRPVASIPERRATRRSYLMCRPEHFTVSYRINPWMHPQHPTDTGRAVAQWQRLYETYLSLGHDVQLIDPIAGLPDMVFTANGGFTLDSVAYGASFTYEQRMPEGPAFMEWFEANGFRVAPPTVTNEGEGDLMLVGDTVLAGTGFRSTSESHREVARVFGRDVLTLTLVDPRFYHLDTALAVLDPLTGDSDANIAYLPGAFDERSRAVLEDRFPDAVLVGDEDAAVLGLNSISDGRNVIISSRAKGFEQQLVERGYNPIGVDLSELLLGGGGVKCCTLELRR